MFLLIYMTFPEEATAREITDILLAEKLLAGSNLFEVESSYHWQGQVQQAGEWASWSQTSLTCWEALKARVQALHPYEVPCIIRQEVHANAAYEQWVAEMTTPPNSP